MIIYNALINTILLICMIVAFFTLVARLSHVIGEIIRYQAYSRHDPTYIVLPFYPLTTRPFVGQAASQYRASVQVISTIARKRLVEQRLRVEEESRLANSVNSATGFADDTQVAGVMTGEVVAKALSSASSTGSSPKKPKKAPRTPKEKKKSKSSSGWDSDVLGSTAETAALENSMAQLVGTTTTAVRVRNDTEEQVGRDEPSLITAHSGTTTTTPTTTTPSSPLSSPLTPLSARAASRTSAHDARKVAEKHRKRQAQRLRAMEKQNQHFKRWFTAVFGSGDIALDFLNGTQQPTPVLGLHVPLGVAQRQVVADASVPAPAVSQTDPRTSSTTRTPPAGTHVPSSASLGAAGIPTKTSVTGSEGGAAGPTAGKGEVWLRLEHGHVELAGAPSASAGDSPTESSARRGSREGRSYADGANATSTAPGSQAVAPPPPPSTAGGGGGAASSRTLLNSQSKRALLELFVATEAARWAGAFARKQSVGGMGLLGPTSSVGVSSDYAAAAAAAATASGFGSMTGAPSTPTMAGGAHARRLPARAERTAVANSAMTLRFTQQMIALWTNALFQDSTVNGSRRTTSSRQPEELFAIPEVSYMSMRSRPEKRLLRAVEQSPEVHMLLARCRVLRAMQPQYTALSVSTDLRALRFVVRHWGDGKGHGHPPVLPLAPPPTAPAWLSRGTSSPYGSQIDSSRRYMSYYDRYSRLTQERSFDSATGPSAQTLRNKAQSFYGSLVRRQSMDTAEGGSSSTRNRLRNGASASRRNSATRDSLNSDWAGGGEGELVAAAAAAASSAPTDEARVTPPSLSIGAMEAANEFLAAIARSKSNDDGPHARRTSSASNSNDVDDTRLPESGSTPPRGGHNDGPKRSTLGGTHPGVESGHATTTTTTTTTTTSATPPKPVVEAGRGAGRTSLDAVLSRALFASSDPSSAPAGTATCGSCAPVLGPSPYDMRVAYIIAADRDTLLRAVTVEATRTFGNSPTNFLCFYRASDASTARHRRRRQLERHQLWEEALAQQRQADEKRELAQPPKVAPQPAPPAQPRTQPVQSAPLTATAPSRDTTNGSKALTPNTAWRAADWAHDDGAKSADQDETDADVDIDTDEEVQSPQNVPSAMVARARQRRPPRVVDDRMRRSHNSNDTDNDADDEEEEDEASTGQSGGSHSSRTATGDEVHLNRPRVRKGKRYAVAGALPATITAAAARGKGLAPPPPPPPPPHSPHLRLPYFGQEDGDEDVDERTAETPALRSETDDVEMAAKPSERAAQQDALSSDVPVVPAAKTSEDSSSLLSFTTSSDLQTAQQVGQDLTHGPAAPVPARTEKVESSIKDVDASDTRPTPAVVCAAPKDVPARTSPADQSLLATNSSPAMATADISILTPFDAHIAPADTPVAPDVFPNDFAPSKHDGAAAPKAEKGGRRGANGGRAAPPPAPVRPLVAFDAEDAHSVYSDDGVVDRYRAAVTVSLPGQTYLLGAREARRVPVLSSSARGSASASGAGRRAARAALGRVRSLSGSSNSSAGSGRASRRGSESDAEHVSAHGGPSMVGSTSGGSGGGVNVTHSNEAHMSEGTLVAEGPSGVEVSALAVEALRHRVRDYMSDHDGSSTDGGDDSLSSTDTEIAPEANVTDDGMGVSRAAATARARQRTAQRRRAAWRHRVRERQRRRARRQRHREQRRRRRRRRQKKCRHLRRQAQRAPLEVDLPVALAVLFFVPSPVSILPALPSTGLTPKKRRRGTAHDSKATQSMRVDANGNIIRDCPVMTCAAAARLAGREGPPHRTHRPAAAASASVAASTTTTTTSWLSPASGGDGLSALGGRHATGVMTGRPGGERGGAEDGGRDAASALICLTFLYGATGADVATALARATKEREEQICRLMMDDDFAASDGFSSLSRGSTQLWPAGNNSAGSHTHARTASMNTLPPSPHQATLDWASATPHMRSPTAPALAESMPTGDFLNALPAGTPLDDVDDTPASFKRARRVTGVPGVARTGRSELDSPSSPLSASRDTVGLGARPRSTGIDTTPQSPITTATLPGEVVGLVGHRSLHGSGTSHQDVDGEQPLESLSSPDSDDFEEMQSWDGGSSVLTTQSSYHAPPPAHGNQPFHHAGLRTMPGTVAGEGVTASAAPAALVVGATSESAQTASGASTAPTPSLTHTLADQVATLLAGEGAANVLSDAPIPALLVVPDTASPELWASTMGPSGTSNASSTGLHLTALPECTTAPLHLSPRHTSALPELPREPVDELDALAPLTQPDLYPEGLGVPVSLLYVRVGDDLYAVTEIVDRTFIQYRQRRIKLTGAAAAAAAVAAGRGTHSMPHAASSTSSRAKANTNASGGGAAQGEAEEPAFGESCETSYHSGGEGSTGGDAQDSTDGEMLSNTSLLFSSAVNARKSRSRSSSLMTVAGADGELANASFASAGGPSNETGAGQFRPGTPVDAVVRATRAGGRTRARRSRREAASAKGFGDLTYSFRADATAPGMRRELVHICWRCLTAEADVVLVPCGHFVVCSSCAAGLQNCCICEQEIAGTIRLYHRDDE